MSGLKAVLLQIMEDVAAIRRRDNSKQEIIPDVVAVLPGSGHDLNFFQKRAQAWFDACFVDKGATYGLDERAFRMLEEALEVFQACGLKQDDVTKLADYVFSRPVGELDDELGGLLVCISLLASAHNSTLGYLTTSALNRNWQNIAKIRGKYDVKPANTPLPGAGPTMPTIHPIRPGEVMKNNTWYICTFKNDPGQTMFLSQYSYTTQLSPREIRDPLAYHFRLDLPKSFNPQK